MKQEDHCHECSIGERKDNDVLLEVHYKDERGSRKVENIRVSYCWTTLGEGIRTVKYARYVECGHRVHGKFTDVVRWQIRRH